MDTIIISSDDDDEHNEPDSLADVSIQVIGEVACNKRKIEALDGEPMIDLTKGLNEPVQLLSSPDLESISDQDQHWMPPSPFIPPSSSQDYELKQSSQSEPIPDSPLIPPPTPSPPPQQQKQQIDASRNSLPTSATLSSSPSSNSPEKTRRTSPRKQAKGNKKVSSPNANKLIREEAKRQKQKEKDEENLRKQANRANADNKALQNCTAIIDKNILDIINDTEEIALKTLFDESMLSYRFSDYPKVKNCITWSCKRTEVIDGECMAQFRESDWILILMEGNEYLKRILLYRDEPQNPESLMSYICDVRKRTQLDIVLIVYNLANSLKNQRARDAKNYRKTFKDRFESRGNDIEENGQNVQATSTLNIGTTDLQELRLMLEMEIKHEHCDWKLHLEFIEKTQEAVQSIARYTVSLAKNEIKKRAKAETNIDWAINCDKEKAHDPTRSSEELTKLWITQLQQFSQITLPIAKTIAAEYPSPSALLDQYKNLSNDEAETLLSRLYVQRNLKRQVGPNISRKIHSFMTSQDPNIHIGYS